MSTLLWLALLVALFWIVFTIIKRMLAGGAQ